MDFLSKMGEVQRQMEEAKKKMDSVHIEMESEGSLLKVTVNANKKVVNISLSDALLTDKEQLEDLLVVTLNKALEKAEKENEKQMQELAKGMLPGMF